MAQLVASMANTANHYHQDTLITVGECTSLFTEHLKIPPALGCKLAAHFAGPLPVLHTIGPVSF